MPRLVQFSDKGPIEIPPQQESVWICGCGLSQNFPHCDGSHNKCERAEPDDQKVYVYDENRKRVIEEKDKS